MSKKFVKSRFYREDATIITQGHKGNLSINARIKLQPSSVTRCITEALDETKRTYGIVLTEWDAQCFSPPPPEPYYRILNGE